MSWNYRILYHNHPEEPYLAIHEVYYDENETPRSCSENPQQILGETLEELKFDLDKMKLALEKPIIEYESFN